MITPQGKLNIHYKQLRCITYFSKWVGFGSCHSFGVAVGCAATACAKCAVTFGVKSF